MHIQVLANTHIGSTFNPKMCTSNVRFRSILLLAKKGRSLRTTLVFLLNTSIYKVFSKKKQAKQTKKTNQKRNRGAFLHYLTKLEWLYDFSSKGRLKVCGNTAALKQLETCEKDRSAFCLSLTFILIVNKLKSKQEIKMTGKAWYFRSGVIS